MPDSNTSAPAPDESTPVPGSDGSHGTVAFERAEYDMLRGVVDEVAETTRAALHGDGGNALGSELRAQPANATWNIASRFGHDVNTLATQVRSETDKLCGTALPEFSDRIDKAAQNFEETDEVATADAQGS